MDIQLVAEGLEFPEGPIAMNDGSVILTEIKGQRLTRIHPDGRKETVVETGGGPNGAAIGPDGAIYITNNGGSFTWPEQDGLTIPGPTPPSHTGGYIQRYDLATGELTTLYSECDGRPFVGPNDLVFDKQGGFWFTDHAKSTHDHREWGSLHYATIDGNHISTQIHQIMAPNGVGLSPDEKTVYYAETLSGRLYAAPIKKPGQLAKGQGVLPGGAYVGQTPGYAFYDSLAVQANGDVCVATIFQGGITTISPNGKAKLTSLMQFGDLLVTNIAFGGKNMKTAYITLSGSGKLISMPWAQAGLRLNFNA